MHQDRRQALADGVDDLDRQRLAFGEGDLQDFLGDEPEGVLVERPDDLDEDRLFGILAEERQVDGRVQPRRQLRLILL